MINNYKKIVVLSLCIFLFISKSILSSNFVDEMIRPNSPCLKFVFKYPVVLLNDEIYESLKKFGLEKIVRVNVLNKGGTTLRNLCLELRKESWKGAFKSATSTKDAIEKNDYVKSKQVPLLKEFFTKYPDICDLLDQYESLGCNSSLLPEVYLIYRNSSVV